MKRFLSPHFLYLLLAVIIQNVLSSSGARGAPLQDLGTLGGVSSFGYGINDAGLVVGESINTGGAMHAFLWSPASGMKDLGHFGGNISASTGINNAGQVTGYAYTSDLQSRAFLWNAATGMKSLGTLGGSFSASYAINESGMVVGSAATSLGRLHAFQWTPTTGMIDLGQLGGDFSAARGINNTGQVAGYARDAGGLGHAFLWSASTGMVDLGTFGGDTSANGINDLGQVVGHSVPPDGQNRAFLWSASTGMKDLGTLGGTYAVAMAINNAGQVAGFSTTPASEYHAFLWSASKGMTDLGHLGGGHSFVSLNAINKTGQVAGYSHTAVGGPTHAFRFTADTAPPVLSLPGGITAEATGASGAKVFFNPAPSAFDAVDGAVSVGCTPASGSTFPLGETTVSCSATDAAGNLGTGRFVVKVRDTTAPKIVFTSHAATYTVDQTVTISCTATDLVGVVSTTCAKVNAPAYTFNLGPNTISATAKDAAGNVGSASTTFQVRVTYASLRVLVQRFTALGGGNGKSLLKKLDEARDAEIKGNAKAEAKALEAFEKEARAQIGESLTSAQASILIGLSKTL